MPSRAKSMLALQAGTRARKFDAKFGVLGAPERALTCAQSPVAVQKQKAALRPLSVKNLKVLERQ